MVKENKMQQTDIGLIPQDWNVVKFDEITELITCGIASTPKYVSSYLGSPFLSSTNVKMGKIDFNNLKFIRRDLHQQLYKNNPPKIGDLLYSRVGAVIGEAAVIEKDLEFSIYVSLTLIKVKGYVLNNYFLMHLLNSPTYQKLAYDTVLLGGGVGNLNVNVVREFPIICPPLAEQEAIAVALSDCDMWIKSLEQVVGKKRLIKQGAMQELLTPKDDWVFLNLGENFTLKARIGWQGLTTSEYLTSGNYSLVTGTDFKNGFIDWNNCVFVEKLRFDQDRNIQLKEKDVLVTKDGTIGKVAFVDHLPNSTTLNSGVFVIRPKKDFNNQFLYYILMSFHFDEFLEKITAGSTIVHLYQKDFIHFNIPTPNSLSEQTRIVTILSDMDTEIEALTQKLNKARQLKQGMMQELLTGRVRLG